MTRLTSIAAILLVGSLVTAQEKKSPFARWEKSIESIEKQLKKTPPPKGAIFFAGSSSIVKWPLDKSFPELPVVKVGFGGSQIADSTHFAGRIFHPYQPAVIVFYAGDNDVASGKKPVTVREHFKAFVKTIHDKNPTTKILFLSIKPSIARWNRWETIQKANALIAEECKKKEGLTFVDMGTSMLGKDGKPRPELFAKDGLHLSPKGYELWTAIVKNQLSSK